MTTRLKQALAFADNYFEVNYAEKERRSFTKFKESCATIPGAPDNEAAIRALYQRYEGKTPTYVAYRLTPEYRETNLPIAGAAISALCNTPLSVTDLVTKGTGKRRPNSRYSDRCIRKLFKKLADANIVDCLEIHTCGRTCIRLYYFAVDNQPTMTYNGISKQASDNQEGPTMTDNHYPGYYSDLGEELAEMYPEDEEDTYMDYEDWGDWED